MGVPGWPRHINSLFVRSCNGQDKNLNECMHHPIHEIGAPFVRAQGLLEHLHEICELRGQQTPQQQGVLPAFAGHQMLKIKTLMRHYSIITSLV